MANTLYNDQSEDGSLKEHTIDWNRINVKELLTSGNFGYVYKGMNRNRIVVSENERIIFSQNPRQTAL